MFIVCVVGATASGKTAFAVELAKRFDGEIISADSMQIYKGMNIATAKPTEEEKCGIPHYMLDVVSPDVPFSVVDYTRMAKEHIADIRKRNKLPIVVGGTGLYINSLIDNVEFVDMETDYSYREEQRQIAAKNGNEYLFNRLMSIDPVTAAKLHPNNLGRIIRALEVYDTLGVTFSEVCKKSKLKASPFEPLFLGLYYTPRKGLYERIDRRVDQMIKDGLLNEAKEFYETFREKEELAGKPLQVTATQAIGYKELLPYIEGTMPLELCVDNLKQKTRNYAKRQLTWFRKDSRIEWLEMSNIVGCDNLEKAAAMISERL